MRRTTSFPASARPGTRPSSEYAFRGVRTGDKAPPPGFEPDDFRIPTLEEVMLAYPDVPINIEIKGASDADQQSFLDNADALAATLTRIGRTDGIIVASFSDAAISHFHSLMPEIDLAPAVAEVAAFKLANLPPQAGRVAFQVPITLAGLVITDADFVKRAHAQGMAVHVWLSNDPENDEVYNSLLDIGVDGVMPAQPAAFERVLCARAVPRPPRPAGLPGRHCNQDRVSIACDVGRDRRQARQGAARTGHARAPRRLRRRLQGHRAPSGRRRARGAILRFRLGAAVGRRTGVEPRSRSRSAPRPHGP